jgi:hypothetical protein
MIFMSVFDVFNVFNIFFRLTQQDNVCSIDWDSYIIVSGIVLLVFRHIGDC